VQGAAAPVSRHLPAAARRISTRSHSLQKHIDRRYAQGKAQRSVAVVREKPIVSRLESKGRTHLQRLVACRRYLKKRLLLLLERDLAVVDPAGQIHEPINVDQLM